MLKFGAQLILTKLACEMRIAPTYKHIVRPSSIRCETLNTPPHDQHYWAWFVDINGGWPDSGNQIADGPTNLRGGSDTMLKFGA